MADSQQTQQKYQQFLQLLPVTFEIAGLPKSETGKYYNADQMEIRARVVLTAFKYARSVAKEVVTE